MDSKKHDNQGITYEEAVIMYDAMWELERDGKTEIRGPRCGGELRTYAAGNSADVFCVTEGCLSAGRRGL